MALHGLGEITLGVTDLDAARGFYGEFGLRETSPAVFASADGGDQLRLVETPYRKLVEFVCAADDADDVARIVAAATAHDLPVTTHADGSISIVEPIVGIRATVRVRARIVETAATTPEMNGPGRAVRLYERAPAIFDEGAARPRRLGHVLYTTPDWAGSMRFLTDVLGFHVSDTSAGMIAFLRCGSDHHNVGLISAPVPFLHHTSWMVNDVDEIGKGAQNLLAVDPNRHAWGLGRHFLGSNLFWYFRDPSGHFAEYFTDLDQIPDPAEWEARDWDPSKALYAWGQAPPPEFLVPPDVDEIAAAIAAQPADAAR
jgi:catechol 2,3-dioxygenase-like lactoylglutathione lyase family enzyme